MIRTMRICAALLCLAIATGCAPRQWAKQGAAPDLVTADQKRCEYEARAALANSPMPVERAMFREIELEKLCMESKGYTKGR